MFFGKNALFKVHLPFLLL